VCSELNIISDIIYERSCLFGLLANDVEEKRFITLPAEGVDLVAEEGHRHRPVHRRRSRTVTFDTDTVSFCCKLVPVASKL
jgi:hypothetical protein